MLVSCLWMGCAQGYAGPSLALRAASIMRSNRVGEATSQSWDAVLWADLSFRVGSSSMQAPREEAETYVAEPAAAPWHTAADGCEASEVCSWERQAAAEALAQWPTGAVP